METTLNTATIAAGPAGQLQEGPRNLQGIVWGAVSTLALSRFPPGLLSKNRPPAGCSRFGR